MEIMKPEVIRYGHMRNIMEWQYLKDMGEKLFGKEFLGFYKETTFMHSEGFMTRKIEPIKGSPAREFREAIKKSGLLGLKFDDMVKSEGGKNDKNN